MLTPANSHVIVSIKRLHITKEGSFVLWLYLNETESQENKKPMSLTTASERAVRVINNAVREIIKWAFAS